jgi:transposase
MLRGQNKYPIHLTDEQRIKLHRLLRAGKASTQKLTHARILLKAEQGHRNADIAQMLEVSDSTVWRVRKRFVEHGLQAALEHKPPCKTRGRRLDGRAEAHLIALACGEPPAGRSRWTLELLADRLVQLQIVPQVCPETVRKTLKKKSAGAASQAAVVHSASTRRRVRLRDGGRAGCLRAPV